MLLAGFQASRTDLQFEVTQKLRQRKWPKLVSSVSIQYFVSDLKTTCTEHTLKCECQVSVDEIER